MLQFAEHARLKRHGIAEAAAQGLLGNVTGEFRERLLQHGPADNQFADQIEHAVNALGVHPQDAIGGTSLPYRARRSISGPPG